jgi:hypothetical protein
MRHPARGPARSAGIDGKANAAGRRHHPRSQCVNGSEAAA